MLDKAFEISENADPYALPTNYSAEYDLVHKNPEDYCGWFNSKSANFSIGKKMKIRVQSTTGEEAKLMTQIPFDVYVNPTSTFVLDSRPEKAHFQIGPSPVMISKTPGEIVIEING